MAIYRSFTACSCGTALCNEVHLIIEARDEVDTRRKISVFQKLDEHLKEALWSFP